MSNYTKLTDFASKDALPSGNASKIVKGTEIDDEFEAIETAIATKADTTDVDADLALKAPLASPALTGTPTAPTADTSTNTTQVATTAFAQAAIDADVATHAALRPSSSVYGHAKIYVTGDTLYIETE